MLTRVLLLLLVCMRLVCTSSLHSMGYVTGAVSPTGVCLFFKFGHGPCTAVWDPTLFVLMFYPMVVQGQPLCTHDSTTYQYPQLERERA